MLRKIMFIPGFLVGVVSASLLLPAFSAQQSKKRAAPSQPSAQQMQEMMKKAAKYTQPGKHHKQLDKMLGTWDTQTRLFLAGRATPPSPGRAVTSWLMKGRWLKTEASGSMMGRPIKSFNVMGYDNFKMSYVSTSVQTMDTAMVRAEGDMDPSGKVLIMYGTLDEYLTGEHDKMVRTVIRFVNKDKMIMEIHDLPIGEKNTKVVEVVYTRAKTGSSN